MPIKTSYKTVCFADICGSTRLYESLGDQRAQTVIDQTLSALSAEIQAMGGRVVKTVGDAVMSIHDKALGALESAKAMQRRSALLTSPQPDMPPLQIHCGLYCGEVLITENDIYGDAVNTAAKLTALAKSGQILTTKTTLKAAGQEAEISTRYLTRRNLGGKSQVSEIHEILWDKGNTTFVHYVDSSACLKEPARLLISFSGKTLCMDASLPSLTLGRGPMNDLVVMGSWVSRNHAQITRKAGNFFLKDQSTNGTHVVPDQGEAVFLKLDEIMLAGSGHIRLGRPDLPSADFIFYEVKTDLPH
jgi:class 3 adenylate cyclase